MKLFKIILALFLFGLFQPNFLLAQDVETFKAKDVIETGIPVKYGNKLFIRVEDKTLTYDVNRKPMDFTTLEDNDMFLVAKNGLNIYLRPLNPLRFSYKTENKIIVDPVNDAAASAMGEIIDQVAKRAQIPQKTVVDEKTGKVKTTSCSDSTIITMLVDLEKTLTANSTNPLINEAFQKLRNMNFNEEVATKRALDAGAASIKAIADKFAAIEQNITDIKEMIAEYPCDDKYVKQFVFNAALDKLIAVKNEQHKRLKNLQTAYDKVEEVYDAATSDMDGLKWVIRLNLVPISQGKVSIYKITIRQSGMELSDQKEIVASEEKELIVQSIRCRKFQRFVPEIAAGTAYTFFKYNEYGTITDANGVQTLALSGQKSINNLNFTTMINFVYYTPNSDVHFLYQIGIGANAEVPTLFTGFGIRSNINGLRRIAVTGGVAFTWVKELTKLKVGDVITGTADIEKDLTHQFSWPPKPYIGLQYNF